MSDMQKGGAEAGEVVQLMGGLPATAVQALYHAATGKTENLTKQLSKDFIVRKNDLDQFYFKILQQLEHFEKVAGPTVTIKVRLHNRESQQFSSWDRFKFFDSGKAEIVSDVVLKFEFIIKMPELTQPQRYVLNIDIDSKLPVVADEDDGGRISFLSLFFSPRGFPSLTVSIDFIDYLCAKNFLQIVEDWFNVLEASPSSKWRTWEKRVTIPWPLLFSRFGNIGAAAFISLYAYLKGGDLGGPIQMAYLVSITIIIWTLSSLLCYHIGELFDSLISRSFVPATVLLTTGDERAFKKVQDRARTAAPKLVGYVLTASGTLFFNVIASFLCAWMTR